MNGEPAWFVDPRPQRHTIRYPGLDKRLAAMKAAGVSDTMLEETERTHTFDVEVRGLTAGDKAVMDELRFTQEGDARLSYGENQLVLLELAIVSWTLPTPLTRETIRQLNPLVAAAIIEIVPDGALVLEEVGEDGGAKGSGPPPSAATEPPAIARDASPEP